MKMADLMNPLDDKLASLKREGEERDAKRRGELLNTPYINLGATPVSLEALKLITEADARLAKIAAIQIKKQDLTVCALDPQDAKAAKILDGLRSDGFNLNIFIVSLTSLNKAWENYKGVATAQREISSNIEISREAFDGLKNNFKNINELSSYFRESESKEELYSSTTKTIESILGASLILDASDLHFETSKNEAVLRFRIDGALHEIYKIPQSIYRLILNRIKLLSGLKINISDAPQDGRFTIRVNAEEIEIRVSIIPSEFGEAIVMRVLNPKAIALDLPKLGMRSDDEETAKREINKPNGMILVTGPTGSGKTTTLYAFLRTVNDPESKIITIEDPIEYHLTGIEQTQVDPKSGYNFASGLRSILRQDPDIILVGEIRDLETAEIAIHAALTGHIVFSTLHTNAAVGAVPRLIDVGIKSSILGPALSLVIAQRLVRRLCNNCKIEDESLTSTMKNNIDKFISKLPKRVKLYDKATKFYKAPGCSKCNRGFKGRVGIFELLEFGDEMEKLITKDATEVAIKELASKSGLVEMQSDGILKALAGMTTLDEVEHVTGPIVW